MKLPSLEDCLTILSSGFIKGAGGFLKTGGTELLKGGMASREVRVGIAQVMLVVDKWSHNNSYTLYMYLTTYDCYAHPFITAVGVCLLLHRNGRSVVGEKPLFDPVTFAWAISKPKNNFNTCGHCLLQKMCGVHHKELFPKAPRRVCTAFSCKHTV